MCGEIVEVSGVIIEVCGEIVEVNVEIVGGTSGGGSWWGAKQGGIRTCSAAGSGAGFEGARLRHCDCSVVLLRLLTSLWDRGFLKRGVELSRCRWVDVTEKIPGNGGGLL